MSPSRQPAGGTVALPRLLLILVPAMLLVPIASDMVSLVLPAMATQFDASTPQVAWVVTGFLLACAVGIPIYGRMADRFELRGLFAVALGIFALGNLAAALAPSLPILVAGRIVSGAGGAAIPVLAIVAATRVLPKEKAAVGIGFIAAAGGLGTALGPAIGGGMGQAVGWPILFWLLFVWAVALIPAVLRGLPATRPIGAPRVDALGGVMLGASVGALLFGVTRAEGADGFAEPTSWGFLLCGAVLAMAFGRRNGRTAEPFIPPTLLTYRGYLAAVTMIFLGMMVNLAALVFVPLMLIEENGLSAGTGALVMIPGGLAVAAVSPLAGRMASRGGGEGGVTVLGLAIMVGATLFLAGYAAGAQPWVAGAAMVALGAGFALLVTAATTAVGRLVPPDLMGAGVGIFQGAQFLGAGAGPAIFGVLLAVRQDSASGALLPFYDGPSPAYSDTFLALAIVALLAMTAAWRLRASESGAAPH